MQIELTSIALHSQCKVYTMPYMSIAECQGVIIMPFKDQYQQVLTADYSAPIDQAFTDIKI